MKIIFFLFAIPLIILIRNASASETVYEPCSFACQSIPDSNHVLRTIGTPTKSELASKRIKVLAWNLYKGRKSEFSSIFEKLSMDKDLIMLSEATTDDPVSTAMKKINNFGWIFATSFEMKNNVGTGTSVGSYAIPKDYRYYRTIDVEPYVKSPKAIAVAEYNLPGTTQTLLALSIHGINWSGDEALVRQLTATLPDLKQHQGPIIFAGDFNIKNPARLKLTQQILGEAGLTRVKWENPNLSKQLDDAFTRGLQVHSAKFINDYINLASDHPAIELDVEL
ncbi:MAG: endonuclease/exonuclease/phosphatase family protein [Pseudobdellovibrio sp.]